MTKHLSRVLSLTIAVATLASFAPAAHAQAQFLNASLKSRTAAIEAETGTEADRFDHKISSDEWEAAKAAEMDRRQKVDNAATYEEFLQLATPEEIAADLTEPIDEESTENMIWDMAAGSPTVMIKVVLHNQTISMTSPKVNLSASVSSGRPGYRTERIARPGCYRPQSVEKRHFSRKYKAWMPYSVFITGGYALHQGAVGGPSTRSHGCVHLEPNIAKQVYETVKYYGAQKTCIMIVK